MSDLQRLEDDCRRLKERVEQLEKERERDRQMLEQLRSERNEFRRLLYHPLWAGISDEELKRWSEDTNETGCMTLEEFLPELKSIVRGGTNA